MSRGTKEIAIGLGCYAAYLAVRRVVWSPKGRAAAAENAERVLEVERRLGLDIEPAFQSVATRHHRVVDVLNASYAAGNVALSVGWLILLYGRNDPGFARERRAAVLAFMGALPIFLTLPTAPPRTRPEFTDTLADRGYDIEHPFLVRFYNPIAAMPSHHVAFAVVTGLGLSRATRTRAGRHLWRGYPAAVAAVVMATANHYTLDVIAGAVLGGVARAVTR